MAVLNADSGTQIRQDSADSYSVLPNIPTKSGSRTMALDPASRTLYLPGADSGPPPAPSPSNAKGYAPEIDGSFVILKVQL